MWLRSWLVAISGKIIQPRCRYMYLHLVSCIFYHVEGGYCRFSTWGLTGTFLCPNRESYSAQGCYGQSKLANVLFTYELQRQLTESRSYVTANAVHPGIVNTDLFRHGPWLLRVPQSILSYFLFKVSILCVLPSLHWSQSSHWGAD